jgi:hypothetical protein
MNVWMQRAITSNPYDRNAFRVTKVPKELVKHRTVIGQITRTKKIIDADSQAHKINEKEVSHAEINAAEEIILDPEKRIYEELLEHSTEKLKMKDVKKLIGEINMLLESDAGEKPPVSNFNFLKIWAMHLVIEHASVFQDTSPSFGALEMKAIPPFGQKGDII